jgi:hypothetical protein
VTTADRVQTASPAPSSRRGRGADRTVGDGTHRTRSTTPHPEIRRRQSPDGNRAVTGLQQRAAY